MTILGFEYGRGPPGYSIEKRDGEKERSGGLERKKNNNN